MEAKLESVLASISNPGLIAGSGGLVTDANARMPYSTLDSGPGGAEGRGDVHVGVDPGVVASALESIRAGRASGTPSSASASAPTSSRPPLTSHRSGDSNPESAITRRDPIVLPSLAHAEGIRFEGGGAIGAHSEIGPSRTGGHPPHTMPMPPLPHAPHPAHHQHHHVHFAGPGSGSASGNVPSAPASSNGGSGPGGLHTRVTSAPGSSTSKSSPMEWSGIKDPNAVDGSPRLHSLPDNTLNPYVGPLFPPSYPCVDPIVKLTLAFLFFLGSI